VAASVIIPTWDRPDLLRRTLEALTSQNGAPPFEVIVVENGSAHTVSLAPSFPAVCFLRIPARGVCAARNAGTQKARAPLLIFLDDDVVPSSTFVEAHVHAHCGSRRRVAIGATRFVVDREEAYPGTHFRAAESDRWARTLLSSGNAPCDARDFRTGNFSIHRDFLLEAKGFDEAFDPFGGEELDLALRLEMAKAEFAFAPQASGTHVGAGTEQSLYDKIQLLGRTEILVLRKHGHMRHPMLRGFVLGRHASWRGRAFRWMFQHTPLALRGAQAVLGWLAGKTMLRKTAVASLDYRVRREWALWTGVRQAIDWPELENLVQNCQAAWREQAAQGSGNRPGQL